MKRKWLIIVSVIIIIAILIGVGIWLYLEKKENERIDAEAVTLVDDLTIEFGKSARASDFIANLNGTLLNNTDIDTERLGEIEVSFDFLNIKNRKRTFTFHITTLDVTAPRILSGSSYTVKTGYSKDLTNSLLSGDDIDDNPKREIIGEYDFNTAGDYNLTYTVTDSSNNKTSKDFVLHVKDKIEETEPEEPELFYLEDILENYKNANTKVGIDVSKWQGEIDWEKVKDSGVEFAIIRVRISDGL